MSRVSSRHNSAPTSRRNSAQSEYDDWFDAYDRNVQMEREEEGPQEVGKILHNVNVALCKALKKDMSDDQRDEVRRMTKKTTGQEAINKAVRSIPTMHQFQNQFDHIVSYKQIKEPMPEFDFLDSLDSKELNNICKRANIIFEGKLAIDSPKLHSFLKFLIKEQRARHLSVNDVLEIMRIKFDPSDFENFENQVEINGFEIAFYELKECFVQQPLASDKKRTFHQFKLDFSNLKTSLRKMAWEAKNAYPMDSMYDIDEKVFEFLMSNIREPLFSRIVDENEKREYWNKRGFKIARLRNAELFDFTEKIANEMLQKRYVRNLSEGAEKNLSKQITSQNQRIEAICSDLEETKNQTTRLVNNVQTAPPKPPSNQKNKGQNKKGGGKPKGKYQKPDWVASGSPRYKEAVQMLYQQYPLTDDKDVFYHICIITDNGNKRYTTPIEKRPRKVGWKPTVTWHGNRYETDSPPIKCDLYKIVGNKSYLTYDILKFFEDKCIACGLRSCFDPYGKHCPGNSYETTWSVCYNCGNGFHKTGACLAYVKEKN